MIEKELSNNVLLSRNQRNVLESAVSFVDNISQTHSLTSEDRGLWKRNDDIETDLTPGEIMHVLSRIQIKEQDSSIQLQVFHHLTPKALERIGLDLLEGTADEQTLLLYKVVVHFEAAVAFLNTQIQGPPSPAIQKHLRDMQFHHRHAALTALDRVGYLTQPSLLLLQALIAGALLMQVVGDAISCWYLTASASHTLVALGYHNLRHTAPRTDADEEIHAAVAWCYHLDASMSMVLVRPLSLPRILVPVASLLKPNPLNPLTTFVIMALELVPVQQKIVGITLSSGPSHDSRSQSSIDVEVALLRRQMAEIFARMEKARPSLNLESNIGVMLHWHSLEYQYFCTLTSVHRLSSTVISNPFERDECLRCARRALESIQKMQDEGSDSGHFSGEYNPYLCWTILSASLCPFFVVFCNVVGTSNAADFQMLKDAIGWIASFAKHNMHVSKLYKLCVALLELCRPLMETPPQSNGMNNQNHTDGNLQNTIPAHPFPPGSLNPNLDLQNIDITLNTNMDPASMPDFWDDSMMNQLFQAQPSLDWFSAVDMFDPGLNHDVA